MDSIFDHEIELESDNIFSFGSSGVLKNKRHIESALVTMEKIILKCEDLVMRAGEGEKGWGGW
jgi:hypothetical protein